MKILFIGETWNGSSARSLRDALSNIETLEVDDIGEDHYKPRGKSYVVRLANRLLNSIYRDELNQEIIHRCWNYKPDVLIVYKGTLVNSNTIDAVKRLGIKTVNVFPDHSPNVYGMKLANALAVYDLIISTKPYHPEHWQTTYGYTNRCVFVPHGYDPKVHLWPDISINQDIDVVIAASWRPQYGKLMRQLGSMIPSEEITVALAGSNWEKYKSDYPSHWQFQGSLFGRSYGEFLRRGKIVIAPVNREVSVNGRNYPGDQDTTRTYELAAAGTFFLHMRTEYVSQIYDDKTEVPLWEDADELSNMIRQFLPLDEYRKNCAFAAHKRAVPDYSIPFRALEIIKYIKEL